MFFYVNGIEWVPCNKICIECKATVCYNPTFLHNEGYKQFIGAVK